MDKYYGKYRGIVRDNNDLELLGRVKCVCPSVFGDNLLDWAYPVFPIDFFGVPANGTSVYIEFENGDIDRPLYTGWWAGKGDKAYTYHKRVIGEDDDAMSGVKGTDSLIDANGGPIDEPANPYDGKYPKVRSMKFPSGLVIEIDESNEDGPRVHLFHPTGSFWEIHPDGKLVRKFTSDYQVIAGPKATHVEGDKYDQTGGDLSTVVDGNMLIDIDGNKKEKIGGSSELEVEKGFNISAKKISLDGGGGSMGGVVTKMCKCAYTGGPHPEASLTVGASM